MSHTHPELMPCLPGETIAQQPLIRPLLLQLKSLVSAPPDIYRELYLATFTAFAEFCQAMPFDMQQPQPYSLLQRQLELAITALKLRRGRMLPQNSESELIAEQEPLWTYAVFTACLFSGLNRLQKDRIVELYLNENEKIGQWSVLAGNLFEPKTFYTVSGWPTRTWLDHFSYLALLIGRIVPAQALRWLTTDYEVFFNWWEAITINLCEERKDGLSLLIKQAAEEIDYSFLGETFKKKNEHTSPSANSALEDFIAWLKKQCEENGCDSERDLLLRIPEGFFIELHRVADFLRCHPQYGSPEHFVRILKGYLLKENDSTVHCYRSARFEERLLLHGVILPEDYLPPIVKSLPYQSSFVSEIPLL